MRLLNDAEPGDAILIEQVDRLSRLNEKNWNFLKQLIAEKGLAINNMLLDMLAAISRKDYEDRRRRQSEGIEKAKISGKFKGRKSNPERNKKIYELKVERGFSIKETAELVGVSTRTVTRVINNYI